MKLLITPLLVGALVAFSGCDKDKSDTGDSKLLTQNASFSWSALTTTENAEIKVFNQHGEPILGAKILIGDAQGNPFRGNFISTDRLGSAIIPNDWVTPASVTVDAAGYIRQTLLNQSPGNISIRLNPAYQVQYPEIKGTVTDLPVVNSDKLIDFALAMPLMKKSELLNLDLAQVISPFSDIISAAGQKIPVPSNISLPKQKESYIIGVTLDKPIYRLKTPTLGNKKLVAVRGRFVFKTVVDQLRGGKAFYDVINDFSILGGGIANAVVTGPITNDITIPGNVFAFTNQVQVNAIAANADELALVLAVNEVDGYMIPSDVKRTAAGKVTNLQTLPNQPTYIISTIKKQSEFMSNAPGSDRISASVLPHTAGAQNKLLPLIANPTITNRENYIINLPTAPKVAGINPVATSAVISDLEEKKEGDILVLSPVRKWEVIGFGWNQQISLPKWPIASSTAGTRKRVEVNYVGSSTSNATDTLDFATHLTHASADF
jgi:hypothetical protein